MPRSPDSTTDAYLDVLRTLDVPDAALHRHHDAAPETPLRAAIDRDRGSPTADLLAALDATGRVLDLRDGLDADDGDRLTAAFGRFGVRIGCETASDESAGVDLHVVDFVTGDTDRVSTHADAESVETTLETALIDEMPIELVELLDGRHLVAESRELDVLAASYGPRIEPYDDPLLVPDAAIEVESDDPLSDGESPSVPHDATAPDPANSYEADALVETADGDSFGEVVAAAESDTAESIETAIPDSGPSTHTIEDDEALAAASSTTVGGGPRRTVSTNGIDEVFDQLESSSESADTAAAADTIPAADTAAASATHRAAESIDSTDRTMSESTDTLTDASASSDDADTTPNGLTGGPTRTVSSTSADDILSRATGDSDFEAIAAEEDGADPDAVLAEAGDVPSALADADASPEIESARETPAADDPDEPDRIADDRPDDPPAGEPGASTATTGATAADAPEPEPAPPADAESTPSTDADSATSDATESASATESPETPPEPATSMPSGATRVGADGRTAVERETADGARDTELATHDGAAEDGGVDAPASAERSDEGTGLADELLEEDVELRRGTETVDEPTTPAQDPASSLDANDSPGHSKEDTTAAADAAPDDPAAADGPLAAAGGVNPERSNGGPDVVRETTPAEGSSGDDSEANADTDGTDNGTETDAETGLVGRITSTIFGR